MGSTHTMSLEEPQELRVLVIAEAANPEWSSVPLVGWSHYEALSRVVDAHLVTQVRNEEAIEKAGLATGREFTAIDSEAVAAPLHKLTRTLTRGKGGWTTGTAISAISYAYFEHQVWKRFGAAIASHEFDIVHRLTPLSPTTPSLVLARKCAQHDVPFVWGPINGGVPWPREFTRERVSEREWLSWVRGLHRLVPGYHATRRHASAIVVGSTDTLAQVPTCYRDKCVYIPENAIDPLRFPDLGVRRDSGGPLRVAFVGRLVPYKGADMLIEAASPLIRDGRVVVDIIGDGPEMGRLRSLVEELNVERGVTLHGQIPHTSVRDILGAADVFGFPSIREFGGAVVLEAMALGVVPVVVAYGGPKELATESTGFLIPLGDRAALIEAFRRVFTEIADNRGCLEAKREAARARVFEFFTWDAKAAQTKAVYEWVCGVREEKPEFLSRIRPEYAS
jgi:glycosyltransferase involved in cell wall biosynthesis